jgi:hypothetical protein
VCTSNSSAPESAEVTERNSSSTGKPLPPLVDDSQDDEKMEGPNALESPPVGKVSDPDLRRLLRSLRADDGIEDATDAE